MKCINDYTTLERLNEAINAQTTQFELPLDRCNSFYYGTDPYHLAYNGSDTITLVRHGTPVLISISEPAKTLQLADDELAKKVIAYLKERSSVDKSRS